MLFVHDVLYVYCGGLFFCLLVKLLSKFSERGEGRLAPGILRPETIGLTSICEPEDTDFLDFLDFGGQKPLV